jgi:hypothetical protein
MIAAAVQKVKKWFAPAPRCHTVNVIEGLRCRVCGEIIPHVDKYETARILFQREKALDSAESKEDMWHDQAIRD